MKVNELINELQKCASDCEVIVSLDNDNNEIVIYDIEFISIDKYEDGIVYVNISDKTGFRHK